MGKKVKDVIVIGKDKPAATKQRKMPIGRRFKPGECGNPAGPPKHRTQLWTYTCGYLDMSDADIAKLDRTKLTQAQQAALKLVENAKKGEYSGSEKLARYCIDRDEGRAKEHVVVESDNTLSEADCENIRDILKNADG